VGSEIKFAAAHEKVTIRIRTNILAFLIDEFRVTNRTIIPPVFLGNRVSWGIEASGFFLHKEISNGRRITYLFRSLNRFLLGVRRLSFNWRGRQGGKFRLLPIQNSPSMAKKLSLIALRVPL
jgi:hypothetical protein